MSAPAALSPSTLPTPSAPALAMFAALLAGATCIGFSGVFVRFADVGPASAGFWRMIFALPVLAAWMRLEQRKAAGPVRPGAMLPIALAGLAFTVDVVLYNASLGFTSIANASLLGNLSPVAVVLGGWLLLGERPSRRILGALMLALGGAAMLVLPKLAGSGPAATSNGAFGDMLATCAAVSYAIYILAVRRARDRADAGRIGLISSALCAVFCLAAALALGETIIPASLQGWLAVIALGLVSHALGQGLITLSLGSYGASAASLVMVWPALVSVLAAWALFGEQPSPALAAGGVAILAAVLLVRRG